MTIVTRRALRALMLTAFDVLVCVALNALAWYARGSVPPAGNVAMLVIVSLAFVTIRAQSRFIR